MEARATTLAAVQQCGSKLRNFGKFLSESTEATLYRCNAAIGATLHASASHLFSSFHLYIYEPEVGIPSAKLLNFLCVLISKGIEQTDVQDTWEYQWIMSWTAVR